MWPNSRHSFTKRCFWKKRHFFRNRGTCTTFNHQWFPNVFFCWRVRSLRHGSFVRVTQQQHMVRHNMPQYEPQNSPHVRTQSILILTYCQSHEWLWLYFIRFPIILGCLRKANSIEIWSQQSHVCSVFDFIQSLANEAKRKSSFNQQLSAFSSFFHLSHRYLRFKQHLHKFMY